MTTEARDIQKRVLPNGLVVLTETMSHVRSVSVGVWIRNGSRREVPEENGLAHFMEHMVFKGTERRSAEEIARQMDSVGGMLDAFTSKEQICFNAKVLDEHLPIAFDIIADLVLRPKFDSEDVKKERQVVLEEIKMDLDNPEYLLHDIFTRGFLAGASARPADPGNAGDGARNSAATRCGKRFQHWFAPDRLVLSAAGNVTHEQVLELVEREFGGLKAAGQRRTRMPRRPRRRPIHLEAEARPRTSSRVHRRAFGAAGARTPVRRRGDEQSARRRHVLAPVPEYSRKARLGVRGVQRAHAVLRRGHAHGIRGHGERNGRPGH